MDTALIYESFQTYFDARRQLGQLLDTGLALFQSAGDLDRVTAIHAQQQTFSPAMRTYLLTDQLFAAALPPDHYPAEPATSYSVGLENLNLMADKAMRRFATELHDSLVDFQAASRRSHLLIEENNGAQLKKLEQELTQPGADLGQLLATKQFPTWAEWTACLQTLAALDTKESLISQLESRYTAVSVTGDLTAQRFLTDLLGPTYPEELNRVGVTVSKEGQFSFLLLFTDNQREEESSLACLGYTLENFQNAQRVLGKLMARLDELSTTYIERLAEMKRLLADQPADPDQAQLQQRLLPKFLTLVVSLVEVYTEAAIAYELKLGELLACTTARLKARRLCVQ